MIRTGRTAQLRRLPIWNRRAAVGGWFAVVLVALSLLTVLRHTAPHLHADGVMQSVMSLQGVEPFFWGQNRFASVVPFLAGPISNPDANLIACLLLNSLSFHGLLLLVAWMGSWAVTADRTWLSTLVLFLALAATVHLAVVPYQIYTMALDTQPYSLSWLLMLGAFLLWKGPGRWAPVPAAAMIGVAVGLNPSVVLGAGFLALVETIRYRQWRRWLAFGAAWLVWFGVWTALAIRFGGTDPVNPHLESSYYGFDARQLAQGLPRSAQAVVDAFTPGWLVALAVVAAVSVLVLDPERRRVLLPRFALLAVFGVGYTILFAGNPWVAANDYPTRYFFPVVMSIVVCLTAPSVGAAVVLMRRPRRPPLARPVPAVATALLCTAAVTGPVAPPNASVIFADVRETAQFATANQVDFLAGNYWVVWPLLHRMLADGHPAFAANYKSGGDPERYRQRLATALTRDRAPRAVCVNDSAESCRTYLDEWTQPGWVVTGATCPIADPPWYADSPARSCRVLEFTGERAP